MDERKYLDELSKIKSSRLNKIIYAVNCKVPEKEIGLENEVEKQFYNNLVKEAKDHEKKYGFWPSFEMSEIESDDPCLDIYRESEK